MPLVQAKCTNCGANLELDNTKDNAVCPFCGTPYIVEKAINNYNVTNNIKADVVNVYGGNSADFVIRAGVLEKYNGAATDVVIPDSVTHIGKEAFKGCLGLTSVTIPNSVTSIGDSAFSGCSGLTSVTIPGSVISIGGNAFNGCSELNNVVVPDELAGTIRDAFRKDAFKNTPWYTYVYSIIESGVLKMYSGEEKDVLIPDSVISIGDYVFKDCSELTSVTIPDSVTIIGKWAFYGCSGLKSITIPDGVTAICKGAFSDCSGLTSIIIGNGVTSIEDYAFFECTSLAEVTIPDRVTSIGEGAFCSCHSLRSVVISNSVISIGSGAFSGSLLESIVIPDSVSSIGKRAFANNILLKYVKKPACISDECFYGTPWYDEKKKKGKEKKSGGCYVATAVYGSYDCPQVWILRRWRDYSLAESWYGRMFICAYYAVSPMVVRLFGKRRWFSRLWRGRLDALVSRLQACGYEDTPYDDRSW